MQCNNILIISQYKDVTAMEPAGCNQSTMWTLVSESKLSCAMTCTSNVTCAVFLYSSRAFNLCQGNQITNLVFNSSKTYSWSNQTYEQNWPLNDVVNKYTQRSLNITKKITPGTVVHLYGLVHNLTGFYINFKQDILSTNVSFLFRARYAPGTLNSIIVLNYCVNNTYGPEMKPVIDPYPFVANTTTTVDILVTGVGYKVFIDRSFCCFFQHQLPFESTNFIYVSGYIEVFEFRM
ncbi:hypothetical protein Bpfe_009633 [Biomphalaria pfeifferi]|uniref:Galectin n=1 Tax=Biomphalaria pfeifferi TaxID=112525 RepID=A0AAD8BUV9_BIOPF|nr:hypothetical protein Bpfe_009633 [Biomphalaria pfeifferi]